jgi:hypothetical protein
MVAAKFVLQILRHTVHLNPVYLEGHRLQTFGEYTESAFDDSRIETTSLRRNWDPTGLHARNGGLRPPRNESGTAERPNA